jgi:hypothetical protein
LELFATALWRLSRGDTHGAADGLRALARPQLWFLLPWTPRPSPAIQVPAGARPAWSRFLEDFTKAYGAADDAALNQSVLDFAAALEALPPG